MTSIAPATEWNGTGRLTHFAYSRPQSGNPRRSTSAPWTDIAEPVWKEQCERQLAEIRFLEDGWDGFNAAPIREDAIEFALNVLASIMLRNTPAPHFTPMSHSGLMLEWHTNGVDLEIEIETPGSMWVSFENSRSGEEYEGSLTSNIHKLQNFISAITTG
jgi:hypothetical protein